MNIFNFEMRSITGQMFIWLIVLTILLGVFMAFFPALQDESMEVIVKSGINSMPESIRQFIFPFSENNLNDIVKYSANIIKFLNFFIAIFAMLMGLNTLAKEQSEGTIDYLYSLPNSRVDIVTMKLIANTIVLFLFNLLMAGITVGIIVLIEKNININSVVITISQVYLYSFIISLVFMSIGMFISSFLKTTSANNTVATLFVIITVIVGLLRYFSSINVPNVLYMLSPIYVLSPFNVVSENIPMTSLIIYLGVFIASSALSYVIYLNKDFR